MKYDVAVVGGGPAGLAAAIEARKRGAEVILIEREARLGGILKQCIHDGFGLTRFGERLSGPEYAEIFIRELRKENIKALVSTFVTRLVKNDEGFDISFVNRNGAKTFRSKTIILATGCRERTARQVSIHGTRPSGVFTAGTAQHFTNILGELPVKKCVILGSGDVGLIMARRLTLEGAEVLGVYEAKPFPSGLTRNIRQCLIDYDIPLYLSHTVTRVFGTDRLTAVEIAGVDGKFRPIRGTEKTVECDGLILSVGLIPENELAESLGVRLDPATKGPVCDERLMTSVEGVFSCGNAFNVNDLVDYVSENGELAGRSAAEYRLKKRTLVPITAGKNVLCVAPQRIDLEDDVSKTVLYFRSSISLGACELTIKSGEKTILKKRYPFLRPPEMEKLTVDFSGDRLDGKSPVIFEIEATEK